MLTRELIRKVVAFDRAKRCGGEYDGRRMGSRTGKDVPSYTEAWAPVEHPGTEGGKPPTRKTLRYNVIVRAPSCRGPNARKRNLRTREVAVVHVAVRLNRAYTPVVKEVSRIDLATGEIVWGDMKYCQVGGWVVEWDRSDWDGKTRRDWIHAPRSAFEFVHRYRTGGALTFPWHETVNPEDLKGTRYEYCQWPGRHGLVDWLMLYRAEPKIETLAKMGLAWLCTPAAAKALRDPSVRRYLTDHAEELRREGKRGGCGVREFVWAAKRNATIRAAELHFELVEEFRIHNVVRGLRIDYERVRKMLPKWGAEVREYARYLSYAARAGLDMRCEGVLYPPVGRGETAFHARLESLETKAERREREARRKKEEARRREIADLMAARLPEIRAFQESLDAARIVDLGKGVRAVLAKSQEELVEEGKRMHNCVGMGHYGEGIVRGNTIIVMFRDGGRSVCDVEIDRRNWSVRQCYFRHNKPATEEYRNAASLVAAHLKSLDLMNRRRAARAKKEKVAS